MLRSVVMALVVVGGGLIAVTQAVAAESGYRDLGILGGRQTGVGAISADGTTIVGAYYDVPESKTQAWHVYRWTQLAGKQALSPAAGYFQVSVAAISPNGRATAGTFMTGNYLKGSDTHVFLWTQANGLHDLGALRPANSQNIGLLECLGVSDSGTFIVGRFADLSGHWHAFRWSKAGGFDDLGTMTGSNASANAVSSDGTVISGFVWEAKEPARIYRWDKQSGPMLGDMGARFVVPDQSRADEGKPWPVMSADGSAVVDTIKDNDGFYRAYCWTQAVGLKAFGMYSSSGASAITAVSRDCSVVAGQLSTANGSHAFLMSGH